MELRYVLLLLGGLRSLLDVEVIGGVLRADSWDLETLFTGGFKDPVVGMFPLELTGLPL